MCSIYHPLSVFYQSLTIREPAAIAECNGTLVFFFQWNVTSVVHWASGCDRYATLFWSYAISTTCVNSKQRRTSDSLWQWTIVWKYVHNSLIRSPIYTFSCYMMQEESMQSYGHTSYTHTIQYLLWMAVYARGSHMFCPLKLVAIALMEVSPLATSRNGYPILVHTCWNNA